MLQFKTSQTGYILQNGKIEKYTYSEFLTEFGSDETTTPRGIAPRLFIEANNSIYRWGANGKRIFIMSCRSKREATQEIYKIWEQNIFESCNSVYFFKTKKDLFEDYAELTSQTSQEVKCFFKNEEQKAIHLELSKKIYDNRPFVSVEQMKLYISENAKIIQEKLDYLDELKAENNKEVWQKEANSLIMQVSNNDFRNLKWKEIYNLIKLEIKQNN